MRTIISFMLSAFLVLQISYAQQSELEKLNQKKTELEKQIAPLSDELKSIEAKIIEIEKKEALLKLKSGVNFSVKLAQSGRVRESPTAVDNVLFRLEKGTIVSVHKQEGSYFYITTYDNKGGWLHNALVLRDEAYKNMIKGFELLQEEKQRQAKLDKQAVSILSKLETDNPEPKGTKLEKEDWTADKNNPEITNTEPKPNENKPEISNKVGQSHLFENNKINSNEGNGWGRWVTATQDIQIVNMGGGKYEVKFYEYGKSQPISTLAVQFSKMNDSWYEYKPFGTGHLLNYIILCSTKLSLMAQGSDGSMNLQYKDLGVTYGYSCSDY